MKFPFRSILSGARRTESQGQGASLSTSDRQVILSAMVPPNHVDSQNDYVKLELVQADARKTSLAVHITISNMIAGFLRQGKMNG